jgi:Neuraminidase (sialidase)
VPTGDGVVLQGGFRNNEFPSLAVDRSSGPSRGTIYVTWADGRNNMVPDVSLEGFMDTYNYPDAMMSKSHDQGRTWSSPVTISPQPASFKGVGRDQFLPAVAVDKDGEVAVCYYDRRADPKNNLIDRFCSTSNNGGTTWTESRETPRSWAPEIATDILLIPNYMGDYDGVTSDFLLANDGFVGAYQIMTDGNPDVFAAKF